MASLAQTTAQENNALPVLAHSEGQLHDWARRNPKFLHKGVHFSSVLDSPQVRLDLHQTLCSMSCQLAMEKKSKYLFRLKKKDAMLQSNVDLKAWDPGPVCLSPDA